MGDIGDNVLQLPSPVEEVVFAPGGTRVFFRTTRWLHRVSSTESGLHWDDAILVPPTLAGARMLFGDPREDAALLWGSKIFLPVPTDEFLQLQEVDFATTAGTGLFGNREQLLKEWRGRLGLALAASQGPDE